LRLADQHRQNGIVTRAGRGRSPGCSPKRSIIANGRFPAVSTIGFSTELALAKGPNQREANAESFLIDSGIREASNRRVAQRSSTEGIDPLARRRGKTRTDSLGDKSPYNLGRNQ